MRKTKIWELYFSAFGFPKPSKEILSPWLKIGLSYQINSVFHITERYKNHGVDFLKLMLQNRPAVFVGFESEFLKYASVSKFKSCNDLLEMAEVIASAEKFYCNQSSGLVIAQAIGHANINLAVSKGFKSIYGLRDEMLL
jgi:hypothetical protein